MAACGLDALALGRADNTFIEGFTESTLIGVDEVSPSFERAMANTNLQPEINRTHSLHAVKDHRPVPT